MESQLRWAGHLCINDERTLKIFMYSQLHDGSRKVGIPVEVQEYKLKQNVNSIDIPRSSFGEVASDRAKWKSMYTKGIITFETSCIEYLRITRQFTKHLSNNPAAFTRGCCSLIYMWNAVLVSNRPYKSSIQEAYQKRNRL